MRRALAGVGDVVERALLALRLQPAELEELERAEVGGRVADAVGAAVTDVGTGAHEGPEGGVVLGAAGVAGRVVEVGQTEVVAELVGEDAEPTVLGLDRVVVDPDTGRVVGHVSARDESIVAADVDADAVGAAELEVGLPAVAPDRVGALVGVARGLVATGVDDLEVVDDAVGLLEVAVAVDVVAVLDVERLEVCRHLSHRLARLQLGVHPDGERIADEGLARGADDAAAVVAAVERLVERHLDPLGHVSVDGVAARRLRLVVLRHAVEVHVLVVLAAVVSLPERRVVDGAVGRRDLVVKRPGDVSRAAVLGRSREGAGWRGGARTSGVLLVSELDDDREDAVGALALELDVLALAELGDLALGALVALEPRLEPLLAHGVLLDREGRSQVVVAGHARCLARVVLDDGGCGGGLRRRRRDSAGEQGPRGEQADEPTSPGVQ